MLILFFIIIFFRSVFSGHCFYLCPNFHDLFSISYSKNLELLAFFCLSSCEKGLEMALSVCVSSSPLFFTCCMNPSLLGRISVEPFSFYQLALYGTECSSFLLAHVSIMIFMTLEELWPRSFTLVEERLCGYSGPTWIHFVSWRVIVFPNIL